MFSFLLYQEKCIFKYLLGCTHAQYKYFTILFWSNVPTSGLFLLYNHRKEMASLRQNGQKYKCPFFKSAKENLQTPL